MLIKKQCGHDSHVSKKKEKSAFLHHFSLETILDSSPDAVLTIDKSGTILYANKKAPEFAGCEKQDILGKKYVELDILSDEYLEKAGKMLSLNFSGQSTGPEIIELTKRDGTRIWVECYATPIMQEGTRLIIVTLHDITEHKLAEEELIKSRKFSMNLLDNAPNPILVLNPDTSIEYINPAFENFTGFSLADIAGIKTPYPWWPEEIREEIGASFKEVKSHGSGRREHVFRKHNGERFWVEVNWAPVLQDGELKYLLINWTDITDLKKVDKALRESQEFSTNLLNNTPNPIISLNPDTSVRYVNPAFEKLTGFTLAEIAGKKTPHPWWPEENSGEIGTSIKETLAIGPRRMERKFRKKNGETFWVEMNMVPIISNGTLLYHMANWVDITGRKQSETLLRTIADSSPIGVYIVQDGKFKYVNRPLQTALGYSAEELIDTDSLDHVFPDDREYVRKNAIAMLTGKQTQVYEYRVLNKDGTIRYVIETVASIMYEGKQAVLGNQMDITNRKKMEDELRAHRDHLEELVNKRTNELTALNKQLEQELSQREQIEKALVKAKNTAEKANQAKSEFLAHMSHEIRTPIHGIIGTINLVLDSELEPEQHQYLSMALSSTDALQGVINDILDLSKIEAGQMELVEEDFDLRTLLEDALETLAVVAYKKGLEITSQISPDVPTGLTGDAGRLRQVVTNLLSNAVKFTNQGEIAASVEVVANHKNKVELHFSVRDTGVGIPPDKQAIIFDPFHQADGSINRKYGGTGLGLTISRHLVSKLGGKIWVESAPEQGSTFHFTAKYIKQKSKKPGDARLTISPSFQVLPVLLVDDNATSRHVIGNLLRSRGFTVTETGSGPTMLQELENAKENSTKFQLVLVDKNMPEMDGFAVAKRVLQSPAPQPSIIMMLPPDNISNDFYHCQKLGIEHYIVKPIKEIRLFEEIQSALGLESETQDKTGAAASLPPDGLHLRVLVTEDNTTSQLIAKKMLEKMGHTVTIANNGLEATTMVEQIEFDLILMDAEMPIMNGLEATRHIRKQEAISGNHVPIIAMTAYAMKEDRKRCLESGMDGYLSKPAKPVDINNIIKELFPAGEKTASTPAVDMNAAMEVFGDDKELLKEAADIFMEQDYPEQIKNIKDGISRQDAQAIRAAAHSIKGAARSLGGLTLGDIAMQLEEKGRNDDLSQAEALAVEIEKEAKRLADFFSAGIAS